MKVLITDQVSRLIWDYLKAQDAEIDYVFLPSKEELVQIIGKYDLMVMRVDPKIDREVLDAAENLKAIAVSAAGLNHIDLDYAKEKGIAVSNASGGNSNAVAEMTFCKILDLARHSISANNKLKYENRWNKYAWMGFELRGKTLGIVGCGKIGSRVAEIAQGFGMKVLAYDPYLSEEAIAAYGAKKVNFETLLRTADVVTLHPPLTDETKSLISYEQFALMKDTALLLNMARGGIMDEAAALDALENGKIGGIGVDVLATELAPQMPSDVKGETIVRSPLFAYDNFIISPHIAGGGTVDSLDALGQVVVRNIEKYFE